MVQVVGVLVVLLVAVVDGVVVVNVDHLVQETVEVPLLDPLLSFPSLFTNSTSFTSMYQLSFCYAVQSYLMPLLTV